MSEGLAPLVWFLTGLAYIMITAPWVRRYAWRQDAKGFDLTYAIWGVTGLTFPTCVTLALAWFA